MKNQNSSLRATQQQGGAPHLVEVIDAERLGNEWVLVAMEYVEGGSLLGTIESGPLPLMDAINVAKGILTGLSRLHSAMLVHRDLKPANILLSRKNDYLFPKIGDFGSVARMDSPDSTVGASRHSALYVPPEGWKQPSIYNFQSDIYQVGLVLSEMINGHLPYGFATYFDGKTKSDINSFGCSDISELHECDQCQVVNNAIARRSSRGTILTLVERQPYLSRKLIQIIKKSTNPDYGKRYTTPIEMLNELNGLSFPNWTKLGEEYVAKNWCGWDWTVNCKNKRGGLQEFHVKRSKCGAKKFIRKFVTPDSKKAFLWVLSQAT